MPPLFDVPERALLDGMLDWHRSGVFAKVESLSDELARDFFRLLSTVKYPEPEPKKP